MPMLKMRFRFGLIAAAVSALVLSISCEHAVAPSTGAFDLPDYSYLAEPAARWSAYGLKNYTIEQKRLCFCRFPHEFVKLTVKDNKIVQGIDLTNGRPVPAEILQYYQTVDSLFAWIGEAKSLNPERLEIEYDSRFGYPKKISYDYSSQIADDELWIETQALLALSANAEPPVIIMDASRDSLQLDSFTLHGIAINGDFCEALLRPQLGFDLRPVAELYQKLYQRRDPIQINVYGYSRSQPGEKLSAIYKPQ